MPKRYLPEFRERAVQMVVDHAEDSGSTTAACNAVSAQIGISREALRRWVNQAQVGAGARPAPPLICAFIDQMRKMGFAVASVCAVLREQGCQIAARTYRT